MATASAAEAATDAASAGTSHGRTRRCRPCAFALANIHSKSGGVCSFARAAKYSLARRSSSLSLIERPQPIAQRLFCAMVVRAYAADGNSKHVRRFLQCELRKQHEFEYLALTMRQGRDGGGDLTCVRLRHERH